MRRSDYRQNRALYWMGAPTPNVSIEILVDRDVRAAEAAGIAWDSEEKPDALAGLAWHDYSYGSHRASVGKLYIEHRPKEITPEEAKEIVRRCHLIPMLRQKIEALDLRGTGRLAEAISELLELLDGSNDQAR